MAVALALMLVATQTDPALFDPATGYRIAHYRGVVGPPPPGVTRIDDRQMAAIVAGRAALLIDVTPAEGATRDAAGAWHLAAPYRTISGAFWYPDAGRGDAAPDIEAWFERGVDRLSRRRRSAPLVLFCRADCWMSWNASWKLVRRGYRDVRWYANGIDGWIEAGRPTQSATPEP